MNRLFLIVAISFLFVTASQAQLVEPLALAKAMFAREPVPGLEKHFAGEYQGRPNGTDLPAKATTSFLLLHQGEASAVVNLTIADSTGKVFDTYLHFKKDSVWKVTAFRSLAMTGMIAGIQNLLESLSETQVDSIVSRAQGDTLGISLFASKEEYVFLLGNSRLTLAADQELINYFNQNREGFERIKDSVLRKVEGRTIDSERAQHLGEELVPAYKKLFISSISVGGYQFGENLNFLIGGMLDNAVGFLFVRDEKDLPEMNPARIIMLREIGNGWYLYKTT